VLSSKKFRIQFSIELVFEVKVTDAKNTTPQEYDERPWGNYTVLDSGEGFKVKRIEVLPGKRLSYQSHQRRSEHWHVVAGTANVTLDGEEITVAAGAAIDIPVTAKHRVENPADEKLIFIEIQTGDYFGEDDIERFDDDFGRV
jgi:mannose-6-phosphate isomerase